MQLRDWKRASLLVGGVAALIGCGTSGGDSGPSPEEQVCAGVDTLFFELCDPMIRADRESISSALGDCGLTLDQAVIALASPGDLANACEDVASEGFVVDRADADRFADAVDAVPAFVSCQLAAQAIGLACTADLAPLKEVELVLDKWTIKSGSGDVEAFVPIFNDTMEVGVHVLGLYEELQNRTLFAEQRLRGVNFVWSREDVGDNDPKTLTLNRVLASYDERCEASPTAVSITLLELDQDPGEWEGEAVNLGDDILAGVAGAVVGGLWAGPPGAVAGLVIGLTPAIISYVNDNDSMGSREGVELRDGRNVISLAGDGNSRSDVVIEKRILSSSCIF